MAYAARVAFPTLILGGAPRCATSSVYRWLVGLPSVAGAARKETFYLMDPGHPLADAHHGLARDGIEGYARLFPEAEVARHRVDATTHYLYQDVASRVLAQLPTRPKVVFLLREPAMRLLSSFRFSRETLRVVDRRLDFTRFVELLDSRPEELGRHVSDEGSRYVLARDFAYGRYVDYLERYVDRLGADRVLVLLTERLRDRPEPTLRTLVEFAGIDASSRRLEHIDRANETFTLRHPRMHSLVQSIEARLPVPEGARELVKRGYWRMQGRDLPSRVAERDLETARELRQRYADANRRLAAMFGLDLSAWSAPLEVVDAAE